MQLQSPTDKPIHVSLLDGTAISIGPAPREVPTHFRKHAFAAGCIPVGVNTEDMADEPAAPTEVPMFEKLRQVLAELRAEKVSLTGAGLPHMALVRARAGWNVSAVQLTDAWNSLDDRE